LLAGFAMRGLDCSRSGPIRIGQIAVEEEYSEDGESKDDGGEAGHGFFSCLRLAYGAARQPLVPITGV